MAAKIYILIFISVALLNGDFVDGKRPQVFRSHLRWPSSQNSYLVEELLRHGFVNDKNEFVKDKIDEEFATWTHRENLPEIIGGLKHCVDKVIAEGRNGNLDAYIQCVDSNENVQMLYSPRN
ncbi:uncharacterized protein LOC107036885 [Diachasma alloeum]|uniref:uncharacterized protein LOC107036885 n=1 Tax=Diachasma alloeum TaxID=454923 RepID=UPI00073812E7|nr:uncharacterized protein LOC107036885 [Diachasma alloeum]